MRAIMMILPMTAMLVPALALSAEAEAVRAAAEAFHSGRRVAMEYLRTGNLDLAAIELDKLAADWTAARSKLYVSADGELLQALAQAEEGLALARAAAEASDPVKARERLEGATLRLEVWRKSHAIRLYADCIAEVNTAFAAVDALWREPAQSLDEASIARLGQAAAAAEQVLTRCDGEAPATLRDKPEFRRLVHGFARSLRLLPDALARRDPDYVHRLIIEQRSLDRLLAFRFG